MNKCEICGFEAKTAQGLKLHMIKKHAEKEEKEVHEWVFLGKKDLVINGDKVTKRFQEVVKKNYEKMEICVKCGEVR